MKTRELVKELETFLRDLKEHDKLYKEFLLRLDPGKKQKLDDQEEQLSRQFGRLGPFIVRLDTIQFIDEGITVNPWTSAFVDDFPARKQQSLRMLIRELSRIIGHYESIDKESILLEDTNILFDALKLHPRIVRVSKTTFEDGHYAEAIRNAFKEVIVTAREVSGLRDLDGKKLMDQAFSVTNPKIKLNNLVTQSEKDEQQSFLLMFGGAALGIRNPKAQDAVQQNDPYQALEYLSIASLLLKKIDERVGQP